MSDFHVISNLVSENLQCKDILSGMFITKDSIVIGQKGLEKFSNSNSLSKSEFLELSDGRFFYVKSFKDEILAKVDGFGSDALFFYRHGNSWAFSNSFLELINHCKKNNWPLTIDFKVMSSMFLSGSIGRQLLSSQTPVAQISIVPPDEYICCNKLDKTASLRKIPDFGKTNIYYEEALSEWFFKWRSILFSLALHSDNMISVDLSGGIDSRMMFSLVNTSSVKEKFCFFSQPHKAKDLSVAKSLCESFNCNLTDSPPDWRRLPINYQYEEYCRGNVGFYNLPVTPPLYYSCSNILKVNGVGGENIRPFYNGSGTDWFKKIEKGMPKYLSGYKSDVCDLLRRSFIDFNIEQDDKTGMMVHYRKLRSRFIGGRTSYENLKFNMVTPLTDQVLVGLNDFSGRQNGKEIYRDIILAGGGKNLISHPYDEKNKSFENEFIEKSPFLNFSSSENSKWLEKEYLVYIEEGNENEAIKENFSINEGESLPSKIKRELSSLVEYGVFDKTPCAFRELYNSGQWSSSVGRKGTIEVITWHTLLKLVDSV
ncbi:hypothetical protein DFP83_11438 [Idiomarina fontislapidosi]|uniref:Asparagine synthetase domain-containing protein n=1 Tax=Idiomarina fontislapidosi TaxID=263723 RepID=A0A432XR80_9GAMM|nr:hypothetical protein [Idiomarina fontislapidosi]PYE30722.1 hypothetical protein DFP83_11438 [Idiomarina fontislapidosi]RUO51111.1 hypothetical protein CWE25_11930 [Idiomarina fontislapidosi]